MEHVSPTPELKNFGFGVVLFPSAVEISSDQIASIANLGDKSLRDHYSFAYNENGEPIYAINQSNHRINMQDINRVPIRINEGVSTQLLQSLESVTYSNLLRYIYLYPDALTSLWWRNLGHFALYRTGAALGMHSDNDVNYHPDLIPTHQSAVFHSLSSIILMNEDFTGGDIEFKYLNMKITLKKGDLLFFPSNYVASHMIHNIESGERISYVSWFGHGSSQECFGLLIQSEEEISNNAGKMWLKHLFSDLENYIKENNLNKPDILNRLRDS